jgi:hypothetical protein
MVICLGWISREDYKKGVQVAPESIETSDLIQEEKFVNFEKYSGFSVDENKEDFKPLFKTEQLVYIHGVLRKDNNPSKTLVSKNDYDQNMWS